MNSFGKIFGAYLIGGLLYVKHERQIKIKEANEKAEYVKRQKLEEINKISSERTYDEIKIDNEYEFLSRNNRKPIRLLPGAKEYAAKILSKS
jgi:hypothetical protein